TQLLDGREHRGAGGLTHVALAVDDAGHRHRGDARPAGHIVDGRAAPAAAAGLACGCAPGSHDFVFSCGPPRGPLTPFYRSRGSASGLYCPTPGHTPGGVPPPLRATARALTRRPPRSGP